MRRGLPLPSLTLGLVVGVLGSGTVIAQVPDAPPIRGKRLQLGAPTVLDWNAARRAERRLGSRGLFGRAGVIPVPVHAPMPVPAMPLPPGFSPAGAPPALDMATAPSLSLDEPMAPATSAGFRALGDNGFYIPPDTHGAVGPTELMTTLNTQVRRQDRNGNPVGGLVSLYGFWLPVTNITSPEASAGYGPFDPRVHYDPDPNPLFGGAGRWIWVACQGAGMQKSALLVGVSADLTPVRGWGWRIDADLANTPTSGVWFDYPNVGFNKKWIVVQANVFTYPGNSFVESRIYVFDKASLYSGVQGAVTQFTLGATSCDGGNPCGATQVPALTYDLAADDLYLMQRWNPNVSGTGYLRVYQLGGAVGAEALTPLGLPSAPAWSDSAAGRVDFAPQGPSCGTNKIQTNDSRIQNVVQRNGRLWTTHTVFYPAGGNPTRASVQWWQVQVDSTVLQTGLLDDPTAARFYAFPSIAVNQNEDVLLGFSSFAASEPASARYTFRLAGDPPGTMQAPRVLKAGEACYYKDFGQGRNRWGDYSATVVDPLDDTNLWTIQEYAASTDVNGVAATNVWSTWWGMVTPPAISIADALVAEGDAGATVLTFNLALSVPVSDTVAVQWTTADDTATDLDNDYVPAGGTVTFPADTTTATIQVSVNGDTKHEPSESFFVNLSSPQYATLGDTQAVGTIVNDEPDPQISIGDVQVVEGDSGFTNAVFTVTLSYPSSGTVSAAWTTAPGTATSPADFVTASGVVSFDPGVVEQAVTVLVVGDTGNEPDETFTVALSGASGGTLLKGVGNGLILNDDLVQYEPVYGLVVVSDGDSAFGRDRLQWLNPTPLPQGVRINFTHGPTSCVPPAAPGPGAWGAVRPDGWDIDFGGGPANTSAHAGLILNERYCYGVWAWYGASNWSARATATGVPFDATGKVKWRYFIGMTTLSHPTVGTDAVLAPSNDNYVHAMVPGPSPAGGGWPAGWVPVNLGSPAQTRSPIVPLGGVSRAYYTTQDGWVHAVNAATGERLWDVRIGTTSTSGQAAPAGIFADFGGGWDYLLVGTRMTSGNKFYALNPVNGGVIDVFPQGTESGVSGIGMINGMAAVDYPGRRVYFGSLPGSVPDAPETLWCLQLGPPSNALSLAWSSGAPGPIDGSPVLRGTRLYVGDTDGTVWSLQMDGSNAYSLDLGDGAVKGFPFPDRRNDDLFVATATKVWGLTDTVGTSLGYKWSNPVQGLDTPSVVLLKPGTNELYVGVRDIGPAGGPDFAGLLRIDTSLADPGPSVTAVELEDSAAIVGPPSLDIRFTPNIIYVGSINGVVYAVEASF